MKVVQINAIYGSKSTGTIVREIQSCCHEHGIECHVAYSISDRQEKKVPGGYHIGNTLTVKWHAVLSRFFGRQAYFNRFTTWLLIKWLGRMHPDIVHLHNLHSNYIYLNGLLRYLARHDIATVITMHDCWYFTGGCTHYTSVKCQRWQVGCGDCPIRRKIPSWFRDTTQTILKDRSRYLNSIPRLTLVGVSEWTANEAKKSVLKNNDIIFIHNGYDLNVFRPVSSDKRSALGIGNRFVIIGPFDKWQLPINKATLDYFISKMTDNMVLVLFGGSKRLDITDAKVKQIGYVSSRQEMAEIYSMGDVMVNCSREDTLSSINIECQACGTPVITYDATGLQETVDGCSGYAVETGNKEELWKKVIEVKEKGKVYYSRRCRDWILDNFEEHDSYAKYIQLYNKINKRIN